MKIQLWSVDKWMPEIEEDCVYVSVDCVVLLKDGTVTAGYYHYEKNRWIIEGELTSPVTHWRELQRN